MDQLEFEANVYASSGDKNFVKISFPNLGMYINSFTVKPSVRFPDSGLWVQTPKYNVNGKWISPIEFDSQSELWRKIEEECRRAVNSQGSDVDIDLDNLVF